MIFNNLLKLLCIFIIFYEVTKAKKLRRKQHTNDRTLWKNEYEDELADAMTNRVTENQTRAEPSTSRDTEEVMEKLMETITANEKSLKKIESIDARLNRLDTDYEDKTSTVLKVLDAINKTVATSGCGNIRGSLQRLDNSLNEMKFYLDKPTHHARANIDGEGPPDSNTDKRLSELHLEVKNIQSSVDAIVNTISEVKNRNYPRARPEGTMDTVAIINDLRKNILTKKCDCNKMGRVDRSERFPTDCHEIQMQGFNVSGIYKIKPEAMEPFYVLCDLTTAGGGWTVFHNRYDGSQNFYKSWQDYEYGFGNLAGEFWLGLEKLHYLTNQKLYQLRVDLETERGQAYAGYSVFTVGPDQEGYRISTLGTYYGTAGDSLSYHAGQKFSTYDMDNDEWKDGSCSVEHGGAWWYKECDKSNLNGKYITSGEESRGQGMYWISYKGPAVPLTKTKMMIRPLPASKPSESKDFKRRIIDSPSVRLPTDEKAALRGKAHAPYKYDRRQQADVFFPNYA